MRERERVRESARARKRERDRERYPLTTFAATRSRSFRYTQREFERASERVCAREKQLARDVR